MDPWRLVAQRDVPSRGPSYRLEWWWGGRGRGGGGGGWSRSQWFPDITAPNQQSGELRPEYIAHKVLLTSPWPVCNPPSQNKLHAAALLMAFTSLQAVCQLLKPSAQPLNRGCGAPFERRAKLHGARYLMAVVRQVRLKLQSRRAWTETQSVWSANTMTGADAQ